MGKYIIKITKEIERDEQDFTDKMIAPSRLHSLEDTKFCGKMDADACIEILQHLNDIKDRK